MIILILNLHESLCSSPSKRVCVCVCVRPQGLYSLPGFSVPGTFQVRILDWVAISSSMGFSQPRDWTHVSCIWRLILYHWTAWDIASTFSHGLSHLYLKKKKKSSFFKNLLQITSPDPPNIPSQCYISALLIMLCIFVLSSLWWDSVYSTWALDLERDLGEDPSCSIYQMFDLGQVTPFY